MLFNRFYSWIKYKTIPSSFLFKNRLFIEREVQNKKIMNNLGWLFRSSKWNFRQSSNIKLNSKYMYFNFIFSILFIYLIFYLFSNFFLLKNFINIFCFCFWFSIDIFDYCLAFIFWLFFYIIYIILNYLNFIFWSFFKINLYKEKDLKLNINNSFIKNNSIFNFKYLCYFYINKNYDYLFNNYNYLFNLNKFDSNIFKNLIFYKNLYQLVYFLNLNNFELNKIALNYNFYCFFNLINNNVNQSKYWKYYSYFYIKKIFFNGFNFNNIIISNNNYELINIIKSNNINNFLIFHWIDNNFNFNINFNKLNLFIYKEKKFLFLLNNFNSFINTNKWLKWVYKYSILHRQSLKFNTKIVNLLKNIDVHFFNDKILNKNLWLMSYLNKQNFNTLSLYNDILYKNFFLNENLNLNYFLLNNNYQTNFLNLNNLLYSYNWYLKRFYFYNENNILNMKQLKNDSVNFNLINLNSNYLNLNTSKFWLKNDEEVFKNLLLNTNKDIILEYNNLNWLNELNLYNIMNILNFFNLNLSYNIYNYSFNVNLIQDDLIFNNYGDTGFYYDFYKSNILFYSLFNNFWNKDLIFLTYL